MSKPKYFIGVVGGRDFDDYEKLKSTLDSFVDPLLDAFDVVIVSGGATGADTLASTYAQKKKLGLLEHIPDWNLGRKAGPMRNKLIVKSSDEIIAFWDGKSSGTASTIKITKKSKKAIEVIDY